MASHDLIERIRRRLEELNRSERKVADVILHDPSAAIGMSIATLAQAASVSEPTVNRFCRNFDAKGYPDFKIKLAQSLAGGRPFISRSVERDDTAANYADKIFSATIAALDDARRSLDAKRVERAVNYLIQAKQIHFFGLGVSGPVARDAQHKFFRFNLPVSAYEDVLMQRMVAAACHTGDMVVVISHTGLTRDLVEAARLARHNGAVVLGITVNGSPLANVCNETLEVALPEKTNVYMPVTSRIIHMTLLDVLATGVILQRGEDFIAHLDKIGKSLEATWSPADDETS